MKWLGLTIFISVLLVGCASPKPITHQPMSVRPVIEPVVVVKTPGAIYSEKTYKPLFSDKKPGSIGDIITVSISESTRANTNSNTSISKSSSVDSSISAINGLPFKGLTGLSASAESQQDFSGDGSSAINNLFNGSITVTVIEVLPNGNLLVSGEKQLAINQGHEFVRFSGVVNPDNISAGQVSSAKVADARLEYKQTGALNSAQVMGWLGRFFLSFLPF